MASEWREYQLTDLIDVKHGFAFKGESMNETINDGPIVVAIGNFDYSGGFRFSSTRLKRYISDYPEEYILSPGDILLAMTCQTSGGEILGIPGVIPDDGNIYLHNQRLGKVIVKRPDLVCPDYLYWLFLSHDFNNFLFQRATGTKILHTSPTKIMEYTANLPPISEQNRIANTLWAAEDKSQLNHQTNQTLESMAHALFKSWFVDFDPVIDNALAAGNAIPEPLQARAEQRKAFAFSCSSRAGDGRDTSRPRSHALRGNADRWGCMPTESSVCIPTVDRGNEKSCDAQDGQAVPQLPEAIRQLFPSSFVLDAEMGWIPEGWEVSSLESLIKLTGGGTPKTSIEEYWNGNIPWFSVVDAPNDSDVFVIDTEKHITQLGIDNSSTKLLREGTTIISARGTVGKCAMVATPMTMNQSCYAINGIEGVSDEFVYYLVRYQVSGLQQRSHGSVFSTITRDTFKSINVPFPGSELTEKFSEVVQPLFNKVLANSKNATDLSNLRDTLLPKLISGELRIPRSRTSGTKA